jgi:putative tryptophan/tyrosine transport system substrate-binding protein
MREICKYGSVRGAGSNPRPYRNRRTFLKTVAASVAPWPLNCLAQTPPKRALLGYLGPGSKADHERSRSGFRQGMRERGYVEGRDYLFEERYADSDSGRLSLLAEELVRLKPDVIVTGNTAAALMAKRATASIPIVGALMTDPVGLGLVQNEARPGTNVTGILVRIEGMPGKQLEIALSLLLAVTKIGILINVNNPSNVVQRREIEAAAAKLAVSWVPVEIRTANDIGPAFQRLLRERANIVLVLADSLFLSERRQIAAFALAAHLPTVYTFRDHVEDGGLISYGINERENSRRTAYYVDRILKGEKPADLPVEFPTKLEMVVNTATAKALGIAIPPTIMLQVDEVIE